jgi:2',3'-cyclic-nucleotide 2'-phosphodiesterase (5'-nucleotidase family)
VAAVAALFVLDFLSLGLVPEAEAIAGVRRRTARRTAVVVGGTSAAAVSSANAQAAAAQQEAAEANAEAAAAQQQAAAAQQPAAAPAPAPTAMVASLPQGCVTAGQLFQCGNTYYKAYMSGSQIVYGVVPGP